PQFTSVNEDFEEDFNEELDQKMSFAKLSLLKSLMGVPCSVFLFLHVYYIISYKKLSPLGFKTS
ncbi:MAG: hypothetical protein JW857_04905, partial [Bacteroidales bacterium]|nr:hypothetical protein [Bacteroidales bacterium]